MMPSTAVDLLKSLCRVVVMLVAVAVGLPPARAELRIGEIRMQTTHITPEVAQQALEEFKKACAPLFNEHAPDVVSVRVTASDGLMPRAVQWGWGVEIEVQVKLKDVVPTFDPDIWASGHTLWYFLGGGAKPGFQAQKRVSLRACGLTSYDEARQEFVGLPALGALLPGPERPVSADVMKHATDTENAWKAEYWGQRNVAYCYMTGCGGLSPVDLKMGCAWRLVIVKSGGSLMAEVDRKNFELDCGRANSAGQLPAAITEAKKIFRKIYSKEMP
jgi:hypothetical protein